MCSEDWFTKPFWWKVIVTEFKITSICFAIRFVNLRPRSTAGSSRYVSLTNLYPQILSVETYARRTPRCNLGSQAISAECTWIVFCVPSRSQVVLGRVKFCRNLKRKKCEFVVSTLIISPPKWQAPCQCDHVKCHQTSYPASFPCKRITIFESHKLSQARALKPGYFINFDMLFSIRAMFRW